MTLDSPAWYGMALLFYGQLINNFNSMDHDIVRDSSDEGFNLFGGNGSILSTTEGHIWGLRYMPSYIRNLCKYLFICFFFSAGNRILGLKHARKHPFTDLHPQPWIYINLVEIVPTIPVFQKFGSALWFSRTPPKFLPLLLPPAVYTLAQCFGSYQLLCRVWRVGAV